MKYIFCVFLLLVLVGIGTTEIVTAQNKVSSESKRDQRNRAREDPWAEFEEEVDSIPRLDFGVNFGAYFPDRYSANFYNGTPDNENNVNYVMSNYYWYQEIKQALKSSDTVFVSGYPLDMHYQVAFTGGLFIRFNFNRKNGIFLEANYTQLKTEDALALQVDPASYPTYDDIRLQPIQGKEGRVLLNLGYQRSFPLKSKIYFFLQGGGTMCYTQVQKSFFVVEGREYSMINIYGDLGYIPGGNSQTFNINQNAFGFGTYFGTGAGIPLNERFGIEPGFSIQYYPVNIKNYPRWKPAFSVYLRILLGVGHAGE